jgi:hypothetical protein
MNRSHHAVSRLTVLQYDRVPVVRHRRQDHRGEPVASEFEKNEKKLRILEKIRFGMMRDKD